MDWTQVLTVFVIVVTNLTTIIVLYCHLDNKTNATLQAINAEMKDFHGRLCAIEERGKGK